MINSDQRPFTSNSALLALKEACSAIGIASSDARLLRLGENAIFAVREPSLVVRIARGPELFDDAVKEVRVAHWLAECDVPAARLFFGVEQPMVIRGHPVTFWQTIPDTGRKASAGELGAVLRRVHNCATSDTLQLPGLDIFGRVSGRLDNAKDVPESAVHFMRQRLEELKAAYATLSFESPPTALHGDAHVKNLVCPPHGRAVLIDFEGFALGPREVDLAVTATEYEIGWHSPIDYKAFCRAYGMDVRDWHGFPVLRDINMLKMTSWLMQNVGEGCDQAEEFARRLTTLRQPNTALRWRPF